MRVLILTPEYSKQGGGIATFYRALAPALKELGVTLLVLQGSAVFTGPDNETTYIDGVRVETLAHSRFSRWRTQFGQYSSTPLVRDHLAAAWAMWEQALLGPEFDLVEACDWGLLFVPPTLENSTPLVVQLHGSVGQVASYDPLAGQETGETIIRLIESSILKESSILQTCSAKNAKFWQRQTNRDVQAIYPAFRPAFVEQPTHDGPALVVGRLQRWKGPETVCQALRLLGPSAPQIHWIGRDAAWDARDRKASQHLRDAYPDVWGRSLSHFPPTSREQVSRRQARAAFNLVPSTWDVFNFTVPESMASGRPTIVSKGAGAAELVEDGRTGFLFEPDDPDSLAAVVDRLLKEKPCRLRELGAAARAVIEDRLNPLAIAVERLRAYQSANLDFHSGPQVPRAEGWLREACAPSSRPFEADAFLDQYSLRTLTRHAIARLGAKAKRRFSPRN